MSYNDQESHHLLTWINQQRLIIGQRSKIYQFQQLKYSSLISLLLDKIDHRYFHHILQTHFDYKLYLLAVQNYLTEEEDLKFKRHQRQLLHHQQSISSLLKIILFLIMRRQVKKQFVPRILQLEEDSQMYLMCEIRRVETWLENRVQIKQVHQTIEKLQEENESLNKKLQEIKTKNMQVRTVRTQLQLQNKKVEDQHRENNSEKGEIIDELGISHPKEYTAIYKDLIMQRNELISSHEQVQSQIATLTHQNQEMRDKIAENAYIIDHLSSQISQYRQVYSRLNKSTMSFTKIDKENIDTTAFQSVRMIQSIQSNKDSRISDYPRVIKEFQQQQPHYKCNIQYSQDLSSRLQEMYLKIRALNQQIYNISTNNQRIIGKNKAKQRSICEAYEQFRQFSFNYALSIDR